MGTPLETFAATLTDEERQLLQSSVAFVLRVVAYADSVVDKKETSAVEKANELVRERFGAAFAGSTLPEALAAADNPDWPQAPYVRKVAAIARRMPADAKKLFDQSLVELALTVAGASGGVLGFGEKLSKDEKYALRRVISAFDIQIEDEKVRASLGF
jgi:hypothetical protein